MEDNRIDPVTLQVINNSIASIIDEMSYLVVRTSYSTLIREDYDFSCSFLNAQGRIIGEGLTNAIHTLASSSVCNAILETYSDSIYPGDFFVINDPYGGASHIPDVYFVKPVFVGGERIGFALSIGHQVDMGGRVAGSNACDNTEIYQEGIRIPCLKLYERGVPNDAIFKLVQKNVRVPAKVMGDWRSLMAACELGETKFLELAREYGEERLLRYIDRLMDWTEERTRAEISAWPNGVYEFTDYLDDDGFDPDPVVLHVKLTKQGDSITIDTTGSSPQVKGSINNPLSSTMADIGMVLRCLLDPTIPANDGTMRPVDTIIPEGSCLNPRPPAGVAGRGVLHTHFKDAIWGAFAQMIPDKVRACVSGIDTGISIGGYYKDGTPFVFVDFKYCSWGGAPWGDGHDACCAPGANYSNHPVEVIEAQYPIMLLQRSFVRDTGGPGKFRGGLAMVDDFLFLEEEADLSLRTDRHKFPPYGLYGGQSGAPSLNILNPHCTAERLSKCTRQIKRGDVLRTVLAGAGGWGDPFERNIQSVLDDVRNEKISLERAKEDYGVFVSHDQDGNLHVDVKSTEQFRQARKRKTKFVERKPRKRKTKVDTSLISELLCQALRSCSLQ